MVSSREEAEDLVQDTYAEPSGAWQSYTPGTNLRAWLLRILTNLNIDRGRRMQRRPEETPLDEGDYYLANRLAEAAGEEGLESDHVVERLSPGLDRRCARCRSHTTSATSFFSSTSVSSATPTPPRSSTFRSAPSCPAFIVAASQLRQKLGQEAVSTMGHDPCDKCEELLHGYLDRELSDARAR